MAGIQHARNAVDVTEGEFIVLVLGAACCEDDAVLGQCLCEVSVILAALHATVAACHHYKLADGTTLDGIHYLVGEGKYLLMRESSNDFACFNLLWRSASLCQCDDFTEIFLAVGIG